MRYLLGAIALAGGCATGICESCPAVTLTANGEARLVATVGTRVQFLWSSTNADQASSTVRISPGPDLCGNRDGPWVVATLEGMTEPLPLLPCQRGFEYELAVTVEQRATGDVATATVTIAVSP